MEEAQVTNTATLDMQPPCHTSPAPLMDKGKRKISDVYTGISNEEQLLCNLPVSFIPRVKTFSKYMHDISVFFGYRFGAFTYDR